jgi:hypothetical protein
VPAGFVPAVSQDGINFRALAQLASRTLPAGQLDGYYRDGTSVHILTRHFTYFAVLNQANFKLSIRIAGTPRVNTSRTRAVGVRVSMSLASPARVALVDARNRTVATSARQLKKGATVVTLALPKTVKPGRYTLVVTAGAKGDVVARQSVVVSAGETRVTGRTRVLLAGYDAIRKDLAAALAPLYPVASSSPSQAAYRLASLTGDYRLVIVEYSVGGTQLIRELRTLFPDVKIVVVTETPTQSRLARAAGADATIRKPATGLAVAKTVLRLLFPTVS